MPVRTDLTVAEVFGPTIQGEGPLVGHPAIFLRLMGCNLRCVWCDTPYTWDSTRYDLRREGQRRTVDDIAGDIADRSQGVPDGPGQPLLVITGGEPMLQQDGLLGLLDRVTLPVQVETAGTIVPRLPSDVSYVVSPKLEHSGNGPLRHSPGAIMALAESGQVIAWKFVVQVPEDLAEVDTWVRRYGLWPVHIMAEGRSPDVLRRRLGAIAPDVIRRGWRLTPRLHIDIWGDGRGH